MILCTYSSAIMYTKKSKREDLEKASEFSLFFGVENKLTDNSKKLFHFLKNICKLCVVLMQNTLNLVKYEYNYICKSFTD